MSENNEIVVENPELVSPTPPAPQRKQSPADLAATFFSLYNVKFGQIVNGLSNKQLRRAFYHAVVFPLEGGDYSPTNEAERNAFLIAQNLISAKAMMEHTVMMEKMQEAQNEELKQPDSSTENNEQVVNQENING